MLKQERFIAFICGILLAFVGSARAQRIVNDVQDYLGPRFHGTEQNAPSLNLPVTRSRAADSLRHWNQIAIDASGLDHTPVAPGELACSANSWARREQVARWRSFTLRCSTALTESRAVFEAIPMFVRRAPALQ